jgi:GNAT superfamily N-acetyltransferase
VRSWQEAYRGLLPREYLDQLRPEDRAPHYDFTHTNAEKPRTIVAVEEGHICGFATTASARDPDLANYGELFALYVDPGHWGRGTGIALITTARQHLWDRGFRHACLWVLDGNTRAERFYRLDGWYCDEASRSATIWNLTVSEHRFLRKL